jgi:hypothetical protein
MAWSIFGSQGKLNDHEGFSITPGIIAAHPPGSA